MTALPRLSGAVTPCLFIMEKKNTVICQHDACAFIIDIGDDLSDLCTKLHQEVR